MQLLFVQLKIHISSKGAQRHSITPQAAYGEKLREEREVIAVKKPINIEDFNPLIGRGQPTGWSAEFVNR